MHISVKFHKSLKLGSTYKQNVNHNQFKGHNSANTDLIAKKIPRFTILGKMCFDNIFKGQNTANEDLIVP